MSSASCAARFNYGVEAVAAEMEHSPTSDRHRMGAKAVAFGAEGSVGSLTTSERGWFCQDATLTAGFVPGHLSPAPIFKHPDHEEEAEGGVPVTFLDDASLDFRARACNNRPGIRNGCRADHRRVDRGAHTSRAGGYEQ